MRFTQIVPRWLAAAALAFSPVAAAPGLSRGPDGTALLDGKPYRGIGINYFDCFLRTLHRADDTSCDAGLAVLAGKKIPFIRFAACGFWPKDMTLYRENPEAYFQRLDRVVASAKKHGIGLIPSLFWNHSCVPDLVGEPMDSWASPGSQTQAWMRRYVREIVSRYANEPAIWAWELGNEFSLQASLPNAAEHRPPIHPELGTPASRSARDDMTYDMVRAVFEAFAKEVRKHDPHRLIVSGDSFPRLSAWHQLHEGSWKHDTPEQFADILVRMNPDPIDGISLHAYEDDDQRMAGAMAVARKSGKPLFVGEVGSPGESPAEAAKCRRLLAAIVDHGIPLAAVWVFDFPHQKEWNITADNARRWQLDAIAEANRRLTSGR